MATIKNVQSLEKLLGICTGLGENYKPGQQKLQVEAMTTLLGQAQTLVSKVNVARTAYESTTNSREIAFMGLGQLSTRLVGALIASGASLQTVEDAKAMARKLSGYRAIDRTPVAVDANVAAAPPAGKRRARGKDYLSATGYFEKLIETLASDSSYQPKETDLQVATLREKLTLLRSNNSSVIGANELLRQARNQRDQVLYQQNNSVYHVGQLVKQYVKSVYGYKHENHKAVSKLPFDNKPS